MGSNLSIATELIYKKCQLDLSELKIEKESIDYEACTFHLNGKSVIYRAAKITPTKIGAFVTIWKRNEKGKTAPFHFDDNFDFILISTKKENLFGQFIFPKSILLEKGIISSNLKQGKMGIRVYPPWDLTANKQAQQTQKWQIEYFVEANESFAQVEKIKQLLGL